MDWDFWFKIGELLVIPSLLLVWGGVKFAYKGLDNSINEIKASLTALNKHVSEQNGRIGKAEARLDEHGRTDDRLFAEIRDLRAASNG